MDKRVYITLSLFIFILVLLIIGCVGNADRSGEPVTPTVSGKTYGVAVTDFSSLDAVYSNEPVDVGLNIQNIGDAEAENIEFNLYQKSGFTGEDPESIDILFPPDRELGVAGERELVFWELTAPDVQSEQVKYLKGSITYDYSSSAGTNVHMVPADLYHELGEQNFRTTSTSSEGPVIIKITEIAPYRIPEGRGEQTVHLVITIRNTGTGVVESFEADDEGGGTYEICDFNFRIVGFEDTENGEFKCDNVDEGNIKLFGEEQARSVKCTGELPASSDSAIEYIFEINASYTYKIDTPTLGIRVKSEGLSEETRTTEGDSGRSTSPEIIDEPGDDCVVDNDCSDLFICQDGYCVPEDLK